jgi:hypothetical protein
MKVDDKPVFEVCGAVSTSEREMDLSDSENGSDRHIRIMTVLKTAKTIRVELKLSTGLRIFTFKPDIPLDSKWR